MITMFNTDSGLYYIFEIFMPELPKLDQVAPWAVKVPQGAMRS